MDYEKQYEESITGKVVDTVITLALLYVLFKLVQQRAFWWIVGFGLILLAMMRVN